MRINWHQNPFKTTVELNEADLEVFRLKLTIHECEEVINTARFHLDKDLYEGDYYMPEEAANAVKTDVSKEVDRLFAPLVKELASGSHYGDCVCQATSCFRCLAENILGVDTIEGLRKHTAAKIKHTFERMPDASINDVLAVFAAEEPVRSGDWLQRPQEEFDAYAPAWRAKIKAAHDWLTKYKAEHFAETATGA